jgi:putative membrane protein
MYTLSANAYNVLKALHIISMTAWMAGLLYLPRLFVYHTGAAPGSEASETFKTMERRLLRGIMNPAMIATWSFGLALALSYDKVWWHHTPWFHAKLGLVILLSVLHMKLAHYRRLFAEDRNTRSARFYRILNEVPTVILIAIVFLVVLKP